MNLKKYILAIIAVIAWGSWGILDKKASESLSVSEMWLYKIIIDIVILPFIIYYTFSKKGSGLSDNKNAIILCIVSSFVCIVAELAFITLLKYNPAGWTVSITSVYPIVTVILGMIFLKETLSLTQVIGSLIICVGLYLIN